MKTPVALLTLLLAAWPCASHAAVMADAFHGVQSGQSVADVRAALEPHAGEMTLIVVDVPQIPVAEKTEAHLIITKLEATNGTVVDEAAFIFGDDKLAYIEIRGHAKDAIASHLAGDLQTFMHLEASFQDMVVINPLGDAAWLITPETAHPHMFMWSNPYLPSAGGEAKAYGMSTAKPAVLEFGATLEDVQESMAIACELSEVQEIEKVWLPNEPERQTQINCYGHVYAGFPRKIEAVFGDGILELAWILTAKGEEDRLRRALVAEFGEPIFVSENVEAFNDGRVVLRKDKPEVLMLSDKLVPIYKANYGMGE